MLYNAIEGAVAGWSKNSMPVLIRLFGVPITVLRQTPIDDDEAAEAPLATEADAPPDLVPEPEPEITPAPEPEPEPTPEPEPEYVPPTPTAPSGFMGSLYGGSMSLGSMTTQSTPSPEPTIEPEPTPEPEPEPSPEEDQPDPQEAVDEVYGTFAGQINTSKGGTRFKQETFDSYLIPPSRNWAETGTVNIGGFETVEVFSRGDLVEGDRLSFKRSDGRMFYYRVHRMLTLGITEVLLTKTYLIPIEVEEFHG